jgi:diacylglycerol kinase (ATP)
MSPVAHESKNVVVVLNGISLKKKLFYQRLYPRLSKLCNLEVVETRTENDAIALASHAADNHAHAVIAAGGDGTLHQVVNGILNGREGETKLPVIGLIPLGSGNDFARTVRIKADPGQLAELLTKFHPKKIDVGRIQFTPGVNANADVSSQRYFVNVADIGMGPVVVAGVANSGKQFGPEMAYYKSIISTFFKYKPMTVKVSTPEWVWEGKVRTLAVANGKYYGHGLCIAPDAKPDDRKFSVFICGNVSVFDFIRYSATLKRGKHVRIPEIQYRETTSIELTSESQCLIEGDGENLGMLPVRIGLIEKQLDFLI